MSIYIKQTSGNEFSVDVEPTTTILEVKKDIEKKTGIHPSVQRLLFMGKYLEDEKTLEDHYYYRGCTLLLLISFPQEPLENRVTLFCAETKSQQK